MGDDMSAVFIGLAAVVIYVIGIFMGVWIGRSKPSDSANNWRGAVPKSDKAPPKPTIRPSPPGKE